jgi:hypothetical protein
MIKKSKGPTKIITKTRRRIPPLRKKPHAIKKPNALTLAIKEPVKSTSILHSSTFWNNLDNVSRTCCSSGRIIGFKVFRGNPISLKQYNKPGKNIKFNSSVTFSADGLMVDGKWIRTFRNKKELFYFEKIVQDPDRSELPVWFNRHKILL